jgi:hypothetical protein
MLNEKAVVAYMNANKGLIAEEDRVYGRGSDGKFKWWASDIKSYNNDVRKALEIMSRITTAEQRVSLADKKLDGMKKDSMKVLKEVESLQEKLAKSDLRKTVERERKEIAKESVDYEKDRIELRITRELLVLCDETIAKIESSPQQIIGEWWFESREFFELEGKKSKEDDDSRGNPFGTKPKPKPNTSLNQVRIR